MSGLRCHWCRVARIRWMTTKFGTRIPFDHDLVPLSAVPEGRKGWIPGRWKIGSRGTVVVAMAPVDHYSGPAQSKARRVAVIHACEAYAQAQVALQKASA